MLTDCQKTSEFHTCWLRNGFDMIRADKGRKAGATETRRKFFALSDGDSFPSLSIIRALVPTQ